MLLKMLLKSVKFYFEMKGSYTKTGRKIFIRPCKLGKGPNCAAWITIVKCGEMYSVCLQYRHQYCKYIYRGIDSCVKIQVTDAHTFVFN
jgi:hypothetical protein